MFDFLKNYKTSKKKQPSIVVKTEIDYDKLADKIAQAMAKYHEKNAITAETITEALNNYDAQKEEKESKEVESGSLYVMKLLLFAVYYIAAALVTIFGASLCYEKSMRSSLGIAVSFPLIFWGISTILMAFGMFALTINKKDEVERHFMILTTLISLLLATLALFFPKENINKATDNNAEKTTISEECDVE